MSEEIEKALLQASMFVTEQTGTCPLDIFDIEPHKDPCKKVCSSYYSQIHLCWKQHFINQSLKNK